MPPPGAIPSISRRKPGRPLPAATCRFPPRPLMRPTISTAMLHANSTACRENCAALLPVSWPLGRGRDWPAASTRCRRSCAVLKQWFKIRPFRTCGKSRLPNIRGPVFLIRFVGDKVFIIFLKIFQTLSKNWSGASSRARFCMKKLDNSIRYEMARQLLAAFYSNMRPKGQIQGSRGWTCQLTFKILLIASSNSGAVWAWRRALPLPVALWPPWLLP